MFARHAIAIYPSVVGFLLGVVQTGLLFQLSFTLSSAFGTFLLITFCWLLGSGIGLYVGKVARLSAAAFLVILLAAYFGCAVLLTTASYDSRWWFVYAALIILIGLYPGVFFRRWSQRSRASSLLFRENNGFIIGLAGATLLYMLYGRAAIWVLPLLTALCLLGLERLDSRVGAGPRVQPPT